MAKKNKPHPVMWGPDNPNWKGDDVTSEDAARHRARTRYAINTCERCGKGGFDRHHIDGDVKNNKPENIQILCRRCHMEVDGRLEKVKERAKRINAKNRGKPIPPCVVCGEEIKVGSRGKRGTWYGHCHKCNEAGRRKWKRGLLGEYCRNCGQRENIEGHHIIRKSKLRDLGKPEAIWDLRNQLPLCHRCHESLTNGVWHLFLHQMPLSLLSFANEHGLRHVLEEADERHNHPEVQRRAEQKEAA